MKKWIITIGICILSTSGFSYANIINIGCPIEECNEVIQLAEIDYKVNESPDGNMQVFVTNDHRVVLKSQKETKVIYEGYPVIAEMDPYSVYSFDKYLTSWSKNSKYLFIKDSIYDVAKDELIFLKDNVVFYWNDNIGIFLAQGENFQLGYDGAIYSEFAVGKKINAFVEGNIVEIKQAQADRYFILDPLYVSGSMITKDKINITTAQLKYDVQELKHMIDNYEHCKLIRNNILEPKVKDELSNDYKKLIDKIKNLKEYKQLEEKRIKVKDKESNIKVNNPVDEFFEYLLYENVSINTRPNYFYQDAKAEEIKLNEDIALYNQSSTPSVSILNKTIYNKINKGLEDDEIFKKLISKIKDMKEFKILNDKIARYESIAPVTFEILDMFMDLVNNEENSIYVEYESNSIPVIEATILDSPNPLKANSNEKIGEALDIILNPTGVFSGYTLRTSSCLDSKQYSASKINDKRPDTAWVEGHAGDGTGESISLSFSQEDLNSKQINSFTIINGYTKNEKVWKQNNRVEFLKVLVNDRDYCYIKLHDTYLVQNIHLLKGIPIEKGDTQIKLVIQEIYKGDKYNDTCITEFNAVGF